MAEEAERFEVLYNESKKFSNAVGLPEDAIIEIYHADSDWEFILKIDALLETASKEVIKRSLVIKQSDKTLAGALDGFIDALPINGRTSLLSLLKATGCPSDILSLIGAVRRARNGFAHDIKQVNSKLIDVIKSREDKSSLVRGLSMIETYNEDELIKMYEADGDFLRFGIVDGTLQFLVLAYHVAIK
jgi:hypothetical protein